MRYCSQCGKKLILKSIGDEGEQKYCPDCDKFYFDNPVSVVLTAIINENNEILLLRQKYISENKWVLCSGYVKKGDTLEETVTREVLEETGQVVKSCEYIDSYYFLQKNLIISGFISYVDQSVFKNSQEVDGLMWCDLDTAATSIERENIKVRARCFTRNGQTPCLFFFLSNFSQRSSYNNHSRELQILFGIRFW